MKKMHSFIYIQYFVRFPHDRMGATPATLVLLFPVLLLSRYWGILTNRGTKTVKIHENLSKTHEDYWGSSVELSKGLLETSRFCKTHADYTENRKLNLLAHMGYWVTELLSCTFSTTETTWESKFEKGDWLSTRKLKKMSNQTIQRGYLLTGTQR